MQKILIIEDDPKIAEHLQSYINNYGYESFIVADFGGVMEDFQKCKPDLVLLAINFLAMMAIIGVVKSVSNRFVQFIFISARVGKKDQVMALENGGDDFITKPFHPEIVLQIIDFFIVRHFYTKQIKNVL